MSNDHAEPSGPRTEAGRALLGWRDANHVAFIDSETDIAMGRDEVEQYILAIEAEASAGAGPPDHSKHDDRWCKCGLRIEDCDHLQENLARSTGAAEAERIAVQAGLADVTAGRIRPWEDVKRDIDTSAGATRCDLDLLARAAHAASGYPPETFDDSDCGDKLYAKRVADEYARLLS